MTKPQTVPQDYRSRDKMTLLEFIADVEQCHFRTTSDTGANRNAMFIWNIVRGYAGMEMLTEDDLLLKYEVAEGGMTLEEARESERIRRNGTTQEWLDWNQKRKGH